MIKEILEAAFAKAGVNRKKKSIAKIFLLSLGWSEPHDAEFRDLQEHLTESVCFAHRHPDMTRCVHKDASENQRAVRATQCQPPELRKSILDQVHQPLAFLNGTFSVREEHWSTYEREVFAIVRAFRKLHHLLVCDPSTRIFTDHRNLLFAFKAVAIEPSLGRHKVLKVMRCALFISSFHYRI